MWRVKIGTQAGDGLAGDRMPLPHQIAERVAHVHGVLEDHCVRDNVGVLDLFLLLIRVVLSNHALAAEATPLFVVAVTWIRSAGEERYSS